jgi:hypothetical protein
LAQAPTMPHFVQTIRVPNCEFTVHCQNFPGSSPGRVTKRAFRAVKGSENSTFMLMAAA